MDAVARLHALPGLAIAALLLVLAATAAAFALIGREPTRWLDLLRRIVLGVIVAEAALGLVLALRGSAPAEWIHWLYGGLIIAALLMPGSITTVTPRSRSWVLAGGSVLAAVFAWRLVGSG